MIRNYFKTAFRGLIKYKEYSIINILGLAIGMACVILILLFVREELSFDQFHKNKDRIYRVNIATTNPQTGEVRERAVGPYRLTKELKPDFPDFSTIIRISPQGRELVVYQEKRLWEEGLAFVEPEIFQTFTLPLLKGDPTKVLNNPYSVVISEETAEKYFGDNEPIGKVLTFHENDFKVTGILDKVPENSQFHQLNMYASMKAGEQLFSRIVKENWGEGSCETFVMLEEGKTPEDYAERFAAFIEVKLGAWRQASPKLVLQPLSKLYLYSKNIATYTPGGDITYVYAFTIIAAFILIIACINFMNLATARSANRAKEVGLRKVVGARRLQLLGQFLCESVLLAVVSLFIAFILVVVSLPAFNGIAGKELSIDIFNNLSILLGVFLIAIFVGVISGSYPALFLSRFNPVDVLAGGLKKGV